MNGVVFVIAAVFLFNVGVVVGAFLFACGNARNSFDLYEVTNTDGATYYLTEPEEVVAATHVDGHLRVRRLRVLT